MSLSFVITKRPIYRIFTIEESRAIYSIEIDENLVEIIFRSNTEKAYVFKGDGYIIRHLSDMIESPDFLGYSLGSTVAEARKVGTLQQIKFSEN
ncbi:MAG: hypothetical protein ACO388_07475 [Saprospiraceae bacterium]